VGIKEGLPKEVLIHLDLEVQNRLESGGKGKIGEEKHVLGEEMCMGKHGVEAKSI
jgi:hypothetical protein